MIQERFPARRHPLLCDVLVDGQTHIVFKRMGNMIFVHIELSRQTLQCQLLIQMLFYIIDKLLIQITLFLRTLRVILLINDPAYPVLLRSGILR